jgi:ABC-type molybdenum transport system ATPase subunit/photorepair protein PhrA
MKINIGKSTLISLITGMDPDFEGDILFCGRPFREYDMKHEIGIW